MIVFLALAADSLTRHKVDIAGHDGNFVTLPHQMSSDVQVPGAARMMMVDEVLVDDQNVHRGCDTVRGREN